MTVEIAPWFRSQLKDVHTALAALPSALADVPWRKGGWTRKQIVGHLIDSAANNRQRFVRASTATDYVGPDYAQDDWVAAHGYASQSWETLLRWWTVEHEILTAVVDRIPSDRLVVSCIVGKDQPVTLLFLIKDYVRHQQWHLDQVKTGL